MDMGINISRISLPIEEYNALVIKANKLDKVEKLVQKEVATVISEMIRDMDELPFPNACFIGLGSICEACEWEYESAIDIAFDKKIEIIRRNLVGDTNETKSKDIENIPGLA